MFSTSRFFPSLGLLVTSLACGCGSRSSILTLSDGGGGSGTGGSGAGGTTSTTFTTGGTTGTTTTTTTTSTTTTITTSTVPGFGMVYVGTGDGKIR